MKKNKGNLALLAVILAAVVGGALPVYVKIGLKQISPFSFTLLRFVLASLFFIPLLSRKNKISFKSFLEIGLISLLSTANIILFSFGIKLTAASIGQMLYAGVPIIVALLSFFMLKEKIFGRKFFGIVLGFIGTVMVVVLPLLSKNSPLSGNLIGNLMVFVGVFFYSLYGIYSKKIQKKYSPVQLTAVFSITTALVVLFPAVGEIVSGNHWWIGLTEQTIFSLFYVGLLGTAIYYLLYQYAIKNGTPIIASMTLYLQPVMTIVWASILLGEKISAGFILATIMVLLGAYLTTR